MLKALARTLQANYPERQAYTFIIGAPWYFRMIWAVVKPWLNKDTRNKIRMLGSNWKDAFAECFEPDQLPEEYGGTMKLSFDPVQESDELSSECEDFEFTDELGDLISAEEGASGSGSTT